MESKNHDILIVDGFNTEAVMASSLYYSYYKGDHKIWVLDKYHLGVYTIMKQEGYDNCYNIIYIGDKSKILKQINDQAERTQRSSWSFNKEDYNIRGSIEDVFPASYFGYIKTIYPKKNGYIDSVCEEIGIKRPYFLRRVNSNNSAILKALPGNFSYKNIKDLPKYIYKDAILSEKTKRVKKELVKQIDLGSEYIYHAMADILNDANYFYWLNNNIVKDTKRKDGWINQNKISYSEYLKTML